MQILNWKKQVLEHLPPVFRNQAKQIQVDHEAELKMLYEQKLLNDVEITTINQVWSTDLTYIRLKHGFLYLMTIIDWFSRFVLDWSLNITLEAEYCVETLKGVLAKGSCDIFNTDQGSQFTSEAFTQILKEKEIKISMDSKGRALDNVFVERLWRSVKYQCVYFFDWETVADARKGLHDYFEFYNYRRAHQALKGDTPAFVHLQII